MRQKCIKILRTIWEKKLLLFLVLALIYAGTATLLHQMYQRGAFAAKSYDLGQYSLTLQKTKEEGCLDFVVDYHYSELAEEAAEAGDYFRMDKDKIYYGNYVYEYDFLTNPAYGDYKVTFPDGTSYWFEEDGRYYYGEMSEEEYEATSQMVLDSMGVSGSFKTDGQKIKESGMRPLTLVDAPDAKYSPELIRSALYTYQTYYSEHSIWDTEGKILGFTGWFWFLAAFVLCTLDFWLELEMFKLSWRIYYQTDDIAPQLKPSTAFKTINIMLCVLMLAGSYVAMMIGYAHLH